MITRTSPPSVIQPGRSWLRTLLSTGIVLTLIITVLSSCASPELSVEHNFQFITEDGIAVAVNSGGPRYTEDLFELVEAVRLQQDESHPESLLYRVYDYRLADDGRFYVLDDQACRIAVFDEEGYYIRSFGREGNGPGEFEDPILRWVGNGRLVIDDDNQYRLSLWQTDGTLLDMFPNPTSGYNVWDMYLTPEREVVVKEREVSERHADGGRTYVYRATVYSPEGDSIGSVTSHENYQSPPYRAGGMSVVSMGRREYYAPVADLDYYPGLGIICHDSAEPQLTWYDLEGRISRIVRIGLERRPVTADDRRRVLDMLQRRIDETEDSRRRSVYTTQKEQVSFMEYRAFWAEVTVDDLGYCWLKDFPLYGSEEGVEAYRVISPEGEYLGDARLPDDVVSICQGHVCTIREDPETGGDEFIVYRLNPIPGRFRYPEK